MKVKVIPVLEDNYMYLVIEEHTREAVAVDVAVPKRLLEIVGREGVSLTTVLTTHYHWDHARGNAELARLRPGLAVLGADERICALTRKLVHGEELRFGAIHVRCLLTPGHTSGHMSYFLWEEECPDPPAVFSGDALLVAGCGLRLESTAQQMYESLMATLGSLPPETSLLPAQNCAEMQAVSSQRPQRLQRPVAGGAGTPPPAWGAVGCVLLSGQRSLPSRARGLSAGLAWMTPGMGRRNPTFALP
ncbi:hydroxyacylglutathione hydrolase-like protein isoform X3 [Neovison vison]|uniref:hydroxyacylglutathione hydrolase-like protein isoform X3 n=1 Tax=Neovison vison TaxID=452646 RepID=UPI001CF021BC|nr:hydroxyacylglutathione hydrolase-like protein isoform X3 [Neogale vison]